MSTITAALLASILVIFAPSDAPKLLLDTTITRVSPTDGNRIITKPRIFVTSGKSATVTTANLEYVITPTIRADATVGLRAVLTVRNHNKEVEFAARLNTELGETTELRLGEFNITTTTSIVK